MLGWSEACGRSNGVNKAIFLVLNFRGIASVQNAPALELVLVYIAALHLLFVLVGSPS